MSDCLHCDINELVEEQVKDENTNLAELAAKVAESLVDGRYSSRKVRWTLENPPGIECATVSFRQGVSQTSDQ